MSAAGNPTIFSGRLMLDHEMVQGLKEAMQRIGFIREDVERVAEYLRTRGVDASLSYAQVLALAHNLLEAEP